MLRIHDDDTLDVVAGVRVVVVDTWGLLYIDLVVGLVYSLDDRLQRGYGSISLIRLIRMLSRGACVSKQI